MKKTLWAIALIGIVITTIYSLVTHSLLIDYHLLKHQDIPDGRKAAWSLIIMLYVATPLMIWLQMETLADLTSGNVKPGAWKRIQYRIAWPYKERFNLFLAQHPVLLFTLLLIPLLYFYIIITLVIVNVIVEWISYKWFELTCWWDDFKVMHL